MYLTTHSLHAGATSGDVNMNFGRAERARYKKYLVPIYGTFLQKCFCKSSSLHISLPAITFQLAPEECRRWALPDDEGFDPLETLDLDSAGANFDTVHVGGASPSATEGTSDSAEGNFGEAHVDDANLSSMDTSHSSAAAGISSGSAPRFSSPPRTQLPPGSRSPSLGLTPLPTPSHSPCPSPGPMAQARTPAGNAASMDIGPTALDTHQTNLRINNAPPLSLPATSGILPPASSNMTITTTRKRKNMNTEGRSSQTLKRPKSTALGAVSVSPPPSPPSSSSQTGAAAKTRAAANTRAATKTPQPARELRGKKGAAVRAASATPPWFTMALEMLRTDDFGSAWTKLLDVWSAFEAQENYFEVKALECKFRPCALSEWQKRYRSPTWRPPVEDMVEFDKEFMTW